MFRLVIAFDYLHKLISPIILDLVALESIPNRVTVIYAKLFKTLVCM